MDIVLFLYITLLILSTVLLVPLTKIKKNLFIITQTWLQIMMTSLFNRDKTFCGSHRFKREKMLAAVHFTGNVSPLQYLVCLCLLCGFVRRISWSFSSSQRELSCCLCCLLPTRGVRLFSGSHSRRRTRLYMTLWTAACKRNHRYWTDCKIDCGEPSS